MYYDQEIFYQRVRRPDDAPETCWEWLGCTDPPGYGRVWTRIDGSLIRLAHRLAWTLEHGAIPLGLHVLHRCDNPPCARPSHLFLGTQAENALDMFAKGRNGHLKIRGSASPLARLTEEQVRIIRGRRGSLRRGEAAAMARLYGVSRTTISRVLRGVGWENVV